MTRLIMWNLVYLDGFFEGAKKWDLDWHEYLWGPELEQLSLEQGRTGDALLFGRVTYEGMAAYWTTAEGAVAHYMNSVPKIVFSRTLTKAISHYPTAADRTTSIPERNYLTTRAARLRAEPRMMDSTDMKNVSTHG